jgi:Uridine kinase
VPLGPGGTREFRRAAHALETDTVLDLPAQRAAPGSVVVVDGLFLHRDELVQYWDFSVLLDVPLSVSLARMAARDGSNPYPSHPSVQRYVRAQQIYLQACRPRDRASVVVDNS